MNQHLLAVINSIALHGITVTYTKVTEGEYNVETGSTVNTETTTSIKTFPKGIKVNQYNYPNLIGKEVIEFLIAGNALTSSPNINDKITKGSSDYTIVSYTEHFANGEAVLYKALAVKG